MEKGENESQYIRPFFQRLIEKIKDKWHENDRIVTAEEAFTVITYGSSMTEKELIRRHQRRVNELIKSKMAPALASDSRFSSYFCVYDLTDDADVFSGDIFEPFLDNGFKVIRLSDTVPELEHENVYLISWKK